MGTVANLAVKISANAQDFEKGVAGLDTQMSGLAGTVTKVGGALLAAFSLNAIGGAIEKVGEWGGKIVDFSNRLGISAEQVQRFSFAAEQGGSSIETVARAMEIASRKIATGDEGFAGTIDKIGVSINRLKNQAPDQQFLTLARALSEVENPAMQDAVAFELFGRSGQELQQFLPTLIADLNRAPVALEGSAQKADELGDAWDRLKTSGEAVLGSVGGGLLASAFENIADKLDRLKESGEAWGTLLTSGSLTGDDGMAASLKIAEDNAKGLNDSGLKPLNITMAEASRIEREIEANIKKTNQARIEATREADKQAAAYRQFRNFVGEREFEDQIAAQKAQAKDFGEDSGQFNDIIDRTAASYDERARLDAEYRQHVNENGIRMMEDEAAQLQQTESIWTGLFTNIRETSSQAFASMLLGATSFKDGFISIWHSIRQSLIDIVSDLLNNVLGGLMRGLGSMLGGGSFSAGAGGMGGLLGGLGGGGGLLGGLFGGGGAAASTSIMGGAGAAGGGGMGAIGALMTNPWTIGAAGAVALGMAVWKGGLFRGGEEALKVNPARDEFLSQFGDVGNKGTGGAGWNLAAKLTEMGFGEGGGGVFAALQQADSMEEYEVAVQAVKDALATGAQQATTDSVLFGTAAATSSTAVNSLSASLAAFTDQALSSAAMLAPVGMIAGMTPGQSDLAEVPGFSGGSGGFRNFGGGTLAMLHGTEAVVRPEDMSGAGGINVSINGGTIIGNSDEFRRAVTRAVLDGVEKGGSSWGKFSRLSSQAVRT
jgi:hypothetical protein